MHHAIYNISVMLPEVKMIVVDDSGDLVDQAVLNYLKEASERGHQIIFLPFDSGFGKKSNVIAEFLDTDYLLIGSDDFDFSPLTVRNGIIKMVQILDENPDIHIVSGRVNNRPYEFDLEDKGDTIIEHKVEIPNHPHLEFVECGLTVNYSLIRKEVFEKVRWDDDVRIGGGEHGAFFVDVKRAGFKVAYATDVNIREQTDRRFSTKYNTLRARANGPERPCFVKRGIKKYILGNGPVDYNESRNTAS